MKGNEKLQPGIETEKKEKLIRTLLELAVKNRISLINYIEGENLNIKKLMRTLELVEVISVEDYNSLLEML